MVVEGSCIVIVTTTAAMASRAAPITVCMEAYHGRGWLGCSGNSLLAASSLASSPLVSSSRGNTAWVRIFISSQNSTSSSKAMRWAESALTHCLKSARSLLLGCSASSLASHSLAWVWMLLFSGKSSTAPLLFSVLLVYAL